MFFVGSAVLFISNGPFTS
uniref:Uncharacterized protein n=1 Tax=Arundo donax TaxID=35708 RepID=A0A0A9HB92_ARUDO